MEELANPFVLAALFVGLLLGGLIGGTIMEIHYQHSAVAHGAATFLPTDNSFNWNAK